MVTLKSHVQLNNTLKIITYKITKSGLGVESIDRICGGGNLNPKMVYLNLLNPSFEPDHSFEQAVLEL